MQNASIIFPKEQVSGLMYTNQPISLYQIQVQPTGWYNLVRYIRYPAFFVSPTSLASVTQSLNKGSLTVVEQSPKARMRFYSVCPTTPSILPIKRSAWTSWTIPLVHRYKNVSPRRDGSQSVDCNLHHLFLDVYGVGVNLRHFGPIGPWRAYTYQQSSH